MNDDFISELRVDWQSLDQDAARHIKRLRRNRWTPHVVIALELLGACASLAVGVWFAWAAATFAHHNVLFALSAGVLLVAAPTLYLTSMRARRPGLDWSDETPESLLRTGIRRAESAQQALRVGRRHLGVLAVFVAVLWVAQLVGLIHALEFLRFYTAVGFTAALTSGVWMLWRTYALRAERAALSRVLALMQNEA